MKIRMVLLFLLATLSIPSHAEEMGLIVGSRHFDSDEEYNEINPGVYVIDSGYMAGSYKNSYSEPTIFAGKVIEYPVNNRIRVYLGYGVVYGYGWDDGLVSSDNGGRKLLPFLLPTLSVKKGKDLYFNMHIVGKAIAWSFSKKF